MSITWLCVASFAVGFFASLGFMFGVFSGLSLAELWDYGEHDRTN